MGAVAILAQMQAGRPALIQKDGGEMLIAIVLDRSLAEAKALVDDPPLDCEASRAPSPSAPPCWGGPGFDHHGFSLTVDIYGDDPVHGGLLDKLI